jgi:thrombospondin type 3 repeat protein
MRGEIKMKLQPSRHRRGVVSRWLLVWIALAVGMPISLYANPPAWWAQRNVTITGATAQDYAAVNHGQVKNIAKAAAAELDANLHGGAGDALHALIQGWASPAPATDDYAPVNLGQLKSIGKLFYDRLIQEGYTDKYPWADSLKPADDFAMANIGQVKNLFAFDLQQWNSLPEWWRMKYFGTLDVSPTADSDGDGLTNLDEFKLGTDPTKSSTAGDTFSDGWKVAHGIDPLKKYVPDTSGAVNLVVFTPLE